MQMNDPLKLYPVRYTTLPHVASYQIKEPQTKWSKSALEYAAANTHTSMGEPQNTPSERLVGSPHLLHRC